MSEQVKESGKIVAARVESEESVQAILAANTSKSSKIRALTALGYDRSTVANLLGIKYQFVRNVLLQTK